MGDLKSFGRGFSAGKISDMTLDWKVVVLTGLLAATTSGAYVSSSTDDRKFPEGFKFAVATASQQIEGAWNVSGKGWNIWDTLTHQFPDKIKEKANADIACDSYHKYKEDVRNAKMLGVDVYRLSISWARIMPKGTVDEINQDGVDYYHNLINELLANGIEPMVTMFHWDLPEQIQSQGGFMYDRFDEIFGDYANFLFSTYGYKVKWWTTFNEPGAIVSGYGSTKKAPALNLHGTGDYVAGHNLLKAHARAYHIYNNSYAYQKGKISLNINGDNCTPKTNSKADLEALQRCWAFGFDYFMHPIFSKEGDYSDILKEQVAKHSEEQGVANRLPTFTQDEVEYIRGTYDFLAIHTYTSSLVSNGTDSSTSPSQTEDSDVIASKDPNWGKSASDWLFVYPEGVRNTLNWVKDNYGDLEIFVTEFGFSDKETLVDDGRINYYTRYFEQMKKAILDDGVNLIGAAAWSLMDNFEWMQGYTERFGLIHVDFDDAERTRTWKKSAHWYKEFIQWNKS